MRERQKFPLNPPGVHPGAAPTIRTANKAIILDDQGRMLVNHMHSADTGADYYLSPGGGQEWGEDRITAMKRECHEEIGCEIEVLELACLRTYVGAHHFWADYDGWFHQEEAYWFCRLADGQIPGNGTLPDGNQIGVVWKTLDELRAVCPPETGEDAGFPVYAPVALLDWLEADPATRPLYLGDTV